MKETIPFIGGHPRSNNDVKHLNDAILQNAEALAKMFDSSSVPVILYGMEVSQSGGNYIVSSGACVYDGELFFCDGGTTSAIPGIKFERQLASFGATTYPLLGTNKDVHTERVANVKPLLFSDFNLVNNTFKPKVKDFREALSTRLTPEWKDITNFGSNWTNSLYQPWHQPAQYRLNIASGKIDLQGQIQYSGTQTTASVAFTLPSELNWPSNKVISLLADDGNVFSVAKATFRSVSREAVIEAEASYNYISLDGNCILI